MTADEIKKEISDGFIGAITLDTSSFGNPSEMSLEHGLFRRLEQFRGSAVNLILSDIVAQEVVAHLEKGAADARAAVSKALKQAGNAWQVTREKRAEASTLLFGDEAPDALARRRFDSFMERTGAAIIKSEDHLNAGELIRRYFAHAAPFSNKQTKKNEFPDALALLALDAWAKQTGIKVLVVSKDGDWIRFCSETERLVVVGELGDALSYFHSDASVVCNVLSLKLRNGEYEELEATVERAIQRHIEGMVFLPQADSAFYAEGEITEVILRDFSINDEFRPVDFDEETLVTEIAVTADVDVSCDFSLSVKDGIDKDYLSMGSTSVTQTEELDLTVLITFDRSVPDSLEIEDIEVVGATRDEVDFGYIEPDWMNEPPDEEE